MAKLNTSKPVVHLTPGKVIKYKSYKEAEKAVRKLGIKWSTEYRSMHHLDPRLVGNPERDYAGRGWKCWKDFLGTSFYDYKTAQLVVRRMKCCTSTQYRKSICKKDTRLHSEPLLFYTEWQGWNHFLGRAQKKYTFHEAQSLVLRLGCRTFSQYQKLREKYPKLPCNPASTYKSDWQDYPTFFGTKREPYYSWEEALEIIRFEEFDCRDEYIAYAQTVDKRLPTNAHTFYKSHWKGWPKFLGTDWKKKYSFEECKAIVALHNLSSLRAYLDLRFKLRDWRMPKDPKKAYLKSGWAGMRDFLSKPAKVIKYPNLEEAQVAVRILGIQTYTEYTRLKRYKEDPRLPDDPDERYADWKGWASFTGINVTRYYTFVEARLVARIHGWRTGKFYQFGCGVDPRLPTRPDQYYSEEGWKGWSDFLGINIHSYEVARVLLKEKGVISYRAYFELVRKDARFPVQPQKQYREYWVNWPTYFSREVTPRKEQPKQLKLYVSTSPRVY